MTKDPIKLRMIFLGTSSFATTILNSLIQNKYNVISVYTRPDSKTGRDQKIQKSAVKILAEEAKIKVFEPLKFNEETINEIRDQKPDILVVAAYGKILPQGVLDIVGFGAINVHPSLLPQFRGPSPIQNALLAGVCETGTTIMLMNAGMDTGDILAQKKIAVEPDEKYPELLEKLSQLSSDLLIETLGLWARAKITATKQDDRVATYCQLIERQDGKIIWTDDARSIYNRYRAFYPWPGIFTYWKKDGSNLRIKLHGIECFDSQPNVECSQGQVFTSDGKILVATGKNSIILKEVQLEGKSKVNITDFINGYPEFIGSILK